MTSLDPDPQMVSAVRIAMSGPMIFLAIPAGVIADRVDRRQLLILTQLMMFSFASLLALLTWQQVITSWSLLEADVCDWAGVSDARFDMASNHPCIGASTADCPSDRVGKYQL